MKFATVKNILGNPIIVVASVFLGTLLGIQYPTAGQFLQPVGQLFMSLLELTLLPIIFAAITLSVSTLLNFKHASTYVTRIIVTFLTAMILVSSLAVILAIFFNSAVSILDANNPELRNISISASFIERATQQTISDEGVRNASTIILDAVPNNIFRAFSQGNTLQVLVFSGIFGVAVSFLKDEKRQKVDRFMGTILSIFQKIIMSLIIFLPLAIFSLMAAEAKDVGLETLFQMSFFVIDTYVIFTVFFLLATFVIMKRVNQSFFSVLSALEKAIFIAFGTRSAIAAIPSMITIFEQKFKCNPSLTKLLVPLGAVVGRFGNIIYSALCVIFIAGIYQTELSIFEYISIILLSVVAGLSATGATGILTLSLLTIVLNPLQLPLGAVLPLLIAVDAIVDPMRSLLLVHLNAAVLSVIAEPGQYPQDDVLENM